MSLVLKDGDGSPISSSWPYLLQTRRCTTLSMATRRVHWARKWVRRARRAGASSCFAKLRRLSSAAWLRHSSCPRFSVSCSKSTSKARGYTTILYISHCLRSECCIQLALPCLACELLKSPGLSCAPGSRLGSLGYSVCSNST